MWTVQFFLLDNDEQVVSGVSNVDSIQRFDLILMKRWRTRAKLEISIEAL